MNIWIVEDDYLQLERLYDKLIEQLGNVQLTAIATEHEFRQKIANILPPYPNVVLLDIMLRWADPAPNMPPQPDDVKQDGYYRAGFRCERLIREDKNIQEIPVFLFTVLDEFDIENDMKKISINTKYIGKNAVHELLSSLKSLCGIQHK